MDGLSGISDSLLWFQSLRIDPFGEFACLLYFSSATFRVGSRGCGAQTKAFSIRFSGLGTAFSPIFVKTKATSVLRALRNPFGLGRWLRELS